MELEKALLRPLLKKATLDFMIKNNFRPISNLAFSGKLIELNVADQIVSHIDQTPSNAGKAISLQKIPQHYNCTP